MRKKAFLISALSFFIGANSYSHETLTSAYEDSDLEAEYAVVNNVAVLKYVSPELTEFEIPSEVIIDGKEYPVAIIGSESFANNQTLKKLNIPSSINTIWNPAFENTNIEEVYIEDIESWCNIDFQTIYSNPFGPETALYIGDSPVESLIIPGSVALIPKYSFINIGIKELILEEGVEKISSYAFVDNTNLTEISLPGTLKTIANNNFSNSPVSRINIPNIETWLGIEMYAAWDPWYGEGWYPEAITSYVTTFDDYDLYINGEKIEDVAIPGDIENYWAFCFAGCNLKSVVIPEGIKEIPTGAFYNCKKLESVKLPDSVTNISLAAFLKSNVSDIDIPTGLTSLGANAFYGSNIKSAEIPGIIDCIQRGTFAYCKNLEYVKLNDGIINLEEDAFLNSAIKTDLELPSSFEYTRSDALSGVSSIKKIIFPEGFTQTSHSLGYNQDLEFLSFPTTIIYLQEDYKGCGSLTSIEIKAVSVPSNSYDVLDENLAETCTLYVPMESVEDYRAHSFWGQFKNIVGKEFGNESSIDLINEARTEEENIIYNLHGQKVNPNDLKHEIYIKNGKKYIAR